MSLEAWDLRTLGLLLLVSTLLGSTWLLVRLLGHRPIRWWLLALCLLAILPALHVAAELGFDTQLGTLRLSRRSLCWVPAVAVLGVLWRLGYLRRRAALLPALPTATWALLGLTLGLAVSGLQVRAPFEQLAIVIAVDQSRSMQLVPQVEERVRRELDAARTSMRDEDLLAVVAFGAQAHLKSPAVTKNAPILAARGDVSEDATDLERALNKAASELPVDSAGKVVLLSDGVATRGNTLAAIARARSEGIPIDVLPLEQQPIANVQLLKLSAPSSVAEGETFDLRLVIGAPRSLELDLQLLEDGRLVQERRILAEQGQTVLSVRQVAELPGLHRLEVSLTSTNPALDLLPEDNRLAAFVRVRGRTRALLVNRGGVASALSLGLGAAGMLVDNRSAADVPATRADLAAYDLFVIEDEPAWAFADSTLSAIAELVREAGAGLLLLGSPTTLGPGGYGRTPLEAVSPVGFELKQDRQRGQVSLLLILDASGSMASSIGGAQSKLALANEGAVRATELLARGDRLGVVHVDAEPHWSVPLRGVDGFDVEHSALRRGGPGGGGIVIDPALRLAYGALRLERSAVKHVLLFADGSDVEQISRGAELAQEAFAAGVTTSVVALGSGSGLQRLEQLSQYGQGRFYVLDDPTRIPEVFSEETITLCRAAIAQGQFRAEPEASGDVLRGIDLELAPPLDGYVASVAKPRAQILLRTPARDPLLATWGVGLGRAGVFTSDYARAWGKRWATWPGAAQLFAQLGRSLARNQDDSQIRLELAVRQGQLIVSADAFDEEGALDSRRALAAHVLGPTGDGEELLLRPRASGRYEASLTPERSGAYLVSIHDPVRGLLLAASGIDVSALDELRATGTDHGTLAQIAEQTGGVMRDTLAGLFRDRLPARAQPRHLDQPLLWLAALLLVASVALRRWPSLRWRRGTPARAALATPRSNPASERQYPASAAEGAEASNTLLRQLLARRAERAKHQPLE